MTTGEKRYSFLYSGSLSDTELHDEYMKRKNELLEEAFENGDTLEFIQEATMKKLSEELEGFYFNVL